MCVHSLQLVCRFSGINHTQLRHVSWVNSNSTSRQKSPDSILGHIRGKVTWALWSDCCNTGWHSCQLSGSRICCRCIKRCIPMMQTGGNNTVCWYSILPWLSTVGHTGCYHYHKSEIVSSWWFIIHSCCDCPWKHLCVCKCAYVCVDVCVYMFTHMHVPMCMSPCWNVHISSE